MALKAMGGRAAAISAKVSPGVPAGEGLPEVPALKSEMAGTPCTGKEFKESAGCIGLVFSASLDALDGEGFSDRPLVPDGEAVPVLLWFG